MINLFQAIRRLRGVDLTVKLFLRLLALHAFSKSNDRAIAATDANLFPVLLFNCQNLIFAPLRSNGQPTIYPADASRRFCQNQPNRLGDQARCFRSSAGYWVRLQLWSSAHAQRKDQQVKATISVLPELRASHAPCSADEAVQRSRRPVHI
jgi:hypothetical protein